MTTQSESKEHQNIEPAIAVLHGEVADIKVCSIFGSYYYIV